MLPASIPAPHALSMPSAGRFELPPEEDDEEGGFDLHRYSSALLRHKWMIVGLGLLGLAAGAGVSRLIKPIYEAQASIQIVIPERDQRGPIQTSSLFGARGWIEISRSFEVLDEVVRRRRLFLQPTNAADSMSFMGFELAESFTPGDFMVGTNADGSEVRLMRATGEVVESAAPGDSLGRSLGFRWVPAQVNRIAKGFRVIPPRDAAVALGREIETTPPGPEGSLLRLQLYGEDPRAIAATINAVAERFVEVATRLKREDLTTRTDVLRAQLARSQSELTAADNALEGFRIGTITLPSDRGGTPIAAGLAETRDPVFDAFFQLRLDREALVNDRDAIVRSLRAPADSSEALVVSLGTIPAIRAVSDLTSALTDLAARRAEARRMAVQFTPEYAPLRQLEQEVQTLERDVVRKRAQVVVDNLNQRIGDFDQRINASSREIQQIPPRVSEEARLRRDFEIAQEIHASLRSAFEQARLAELSAAPDVRVLDSAVPPTTPVADRIIMVIAGGLVGGLGLGIALALLLDRFDNRIRYPGQVTRDLGLQILGAIPLVRETKSRAANEDARAQLLEALRAIRMSMVYAHGTAGSFITTITSPGAGEGKSFLSANLAKSFADAGQSTLLIDGDTRRGALHRTLGVSRKPGLLDFLSGTTTLESAIQTIPARGFDFLACGTRMSSGPELLASPAMAQMLMGLRSRYAAIIVDSPPLGAGIDPLVLASLCGSMVLVLRNGVTDQDLAESKLGDLHRLPIRLLGAVLNDVKPEGIYRYYSYLPGYRADDEGVEVEGPDTPPSKRGRLLGKG
jgi:capsular exopolysaccharide synthesis family protein